MYSEAVRVNVEDSKSFELSFLLDAQSSCTSYIQTEKETKISMVESSMRGALASSNCGISSISCFAGSTMVCGVIPSVVYFT